MLSGLHHRDLEFTICDCRFSISGLRAKIGGRAQAPLLVSYARIGKRDARGLEQAQRKKLLFHPSSSHFDDHRNMDTANSDESASMFRWLWFTAGQGKLWNCDSTYCRVPYEYLPSVKHATDDLAWLDLVSPELRQVVGSATLSNTTNEIAHLETITTKFQNLGINFPAPFLRFMRDSRLQQKVPTCTDCYLSLSEEPVQLPYTPGQYLLRFLNDSQSCVIWYLLFRPGDEIRVLASSVFLEPDIFKAMEYEDLRYQDAFKEVFFCAGSFTEFLYRFWIENTLWFSMQHSLDLTLLQEEYRQRITRRL